MDFWPDKLTWSILIAFAVTISGIAYGLYRFVSYILYRLCPFKIKCQKVLRYKKLEVSSSTVIQIGTSDIILRLMPRRPQLFENIHVRLVDKQKWKGVSFPTRETASVTALKAEGLIGSHKLSTKEDHTNGIEGIYEPSFHRAPEEALILTVTISSNIVWSGFLVFRAKDRFDHQHCEYLPINIDPIEQ